MPHAIFDLGPQTAAIEGAVRTLIPGIEPGGSRLGQALKPALLIQDVWAEVVRMQVQDSAPDFAVVTYMLKLSQELDLNPGLLLPVAQLIASHTAAGADSSGVQVIPLGDKLAGTVWVPKVVGVRAVENQATLAIHHVLIHLEYEMIDIPYWDWFIEWDFLDNVVDNSQDY